MTKTANQPEGEKPDDGLRVVHGEDQVRIIEQDGTTSVTINRSLKQYDRPFRVQCWASTQEIKDAEGKTVARTTNPEMAQHICNLLIAHSMWTERKVAART